MDNSLMLRSEHKRILGDALARGDERARAMKHAGYWYGVGTTIWVTGFAAFFAALVGFNFGLSMVQ
jgi:ABC-type amino acid transport system permease subunit